MEDSTIVFVTLIICAFSTIAFVMWVRERAEDRRERRRLTAPARAARHAPRGLASEGEELGAWVPQLLEGFGVDPEVLFDEEMPDDLRALLPLAKGFIQGGGLEKLLKQAPQAEIGPDYVDQV